MAQPTPIEAADAIQRDGRLLTWLMKPFCKLDLPDHIEVREDRPTIVFANHRSLLDVFTTATFCYSAKTSCRVFVQAAYFKSPIMGRWLRRIGAIPLNRDTRDEAFAEAKRSLKNHELIGVMPEGRLIPPEEWDPQVGKARPGAAELANDMDAWMRAIVFHNTQKVWPRGSWPRPRFWNRPVVTMRLDEQHFPVTGDPQADVDRIMERLTQMLDELDAIDAARKG